MSRSGSRYTLCLLLLLHYLSLLIGHDRQRHGFPTRPARQEDALRIHERSVPSFPTTPHHPPVGRKKGQRLDDPGFRAPGVPVDEGGQDGCDARRRGVGRAGRVVAAATAAGGGRATATAAAAAPAPPTARGRRGHRRLFVLPPILLGRRVRVEQVG